MSSSPTPRRRPRSASLTANPVATVALVVVALVAIAVALAPVLSPYGSNEQDLAHIFEGPSAAHWLGTDSLGRDVLSRLLWGGQPTLLGVLAAVVAFVVAGVVLGVLAGTIGGWVDALVSAVADILMSLPGVVLILAILAIFNQDLAPAMIALGLLGSGSLVRVVRAAVLAVRSELFVSAAIVSGLRPGRIMARHILPTVVSPVIIQASLFAGAALAVQSGLGFLSLGVHPPEPTWGGMVGEAAANLAKAPWLLTVSGGIITLVSLGFALIGDGLRDADAARRRGGEVAAPRTVAAPAAPAAATAAAADAASPGATGAVLEVRDLVIAFGGRPPREVVRGVSFEVRAGEVLGLVGESGSGKTVTTLAALGLLPPGAAVTSGRIVLAGADVTGADDAAFRGIRGRRVGLISQEPMVALDPLFTVGSQLGDVLRHATDLDRRQRRARALELLAQVHLPEPAAVLRKYPHELSGGMAQRVAIALALAGDPELLVADEPTTALDVTVQAGILDLLRELQAARGLAVLFVTHDLAVVADICDRVVVMENGEIVESGSVDELFARPREAYTRELLASTPNLVSTT
ncbi:MAG: dipeptide/oligopeptide/nickel ABC transporter permease/ATP-binding protein [Actinomycetales bacterium]|nr:dipeptide/oligopeptide/nickel ABC transporter permease/ATP-binding protein [Actinomycetales bacterium]